MKELYFLIPFHIFAYEKRLESINSNSGKLEDLWQVYKRFAYVLQQKVKEGRMAEYERQVIRDMTVRVANSLAAKWPNVKKGVADIMGAILELEVDKILNRGIDIGRAEDLSEGRISMLIMLVHNGILDLAEGAKWANMTQEEFERKINGI